MKAKLIVVAGRATQSEVTIRPPATVGRRREAQVTIAHSTVSRRHCEILERDGLLVVRDLHSLNGTFLDGKPVEQAELRPGHELTVGPLTFRAEYEWADPAIGGISPTSGQTAVAEPPLVAALPDEVLQDAAAPEVDVTDFETDVARSTGDSAVDPLELSWEEQLRTLAESAVPAAPQTSADALDSPSTSTAFSDIGGVEELPLDELSSDEVSVDELALDEDTSDFSLESGIEPERKLTSSDTDPAELFADTMVDEGTSVSAEQLEFVASSAQEPAADDETGFTLSLDEPAPLPPPDEQPVREDALAPAEQPFEPENEQTPKGAGGSALDDEIVGLVEWESNDDDEIGFELSADISPEYESPVTPKSAELVPEERSQSEPDRPLTALAGSEQVRGTMVPGSSTSAERVKVAPVPPAVEPETKPKRRWFSFGGGKRSKTPAAEASPVSPAEPLAVSPTLSESEGVDSLSLPEVAAEADIEENGADHASSTTETAPKPAAKKGWWPFGKSKQQPAAEPERPTAEPRAMTPPAQLAANVEQESLKMRQTMVPTPHTPIPEPESPSEVEAFAESVPFEDLDDLDDLLSDVQPAAPSSPAQKTQAKSKPQQARAAASDDDLDDFMKELGLD